MNHQFERHPRYSFWGARTTFSRTLCKTLVLFFSISWVIFECIDLLKTKQTIELLASQEQEIRYKIDEVNAKQQKSIQLPASTLTQLQIRGYNSVIRQLNLPWKNIFDDLEAATPTDVALISIEPDGARSTVKLVAEAKSLTTLLNYSSKLQQTGIFGQLTFSKHETNEQDVNKPIRLSFELELQQSELGNVTKSSTEALSKVSLQR